MDDGNQWFLAVYDVRGIQEFVFRTPKLRENTGASYIVANIFTEALNAAIEKLCWEANACRLDWEHYDEFKLPTDPGVKMEILYTGAGNTYIAYRAQADYEALNRFVSKYVLEHTYSLNLAIAVVPAAGSYAETYEALVKKLAENKAKMPMTRLLGSLPVTRQDSDTGYPLSHYYAPGGNQSEIEPVPKERKLKLDAFSRAGYKDEEKNLDGLISEKGVDSQIAIVHIDGNNMGKRFAEEMRSTADYAEAAQKSRNLSKSIAEDFSKALDETKERLAKFVASERCSFENKYYDEKHGKCKRYIRTVISSGDDITFICNARTAISLCEIFLNKLSKGTNHFTACAGIAIINSHFPFHAGYELAEQCCAEAKNRAKEAARKQAEAAGSEREAGNYMDFQICKSIMTATDLTRSRRENYELPDGTRLLARPYCADAGLPETGLPETDPHSLSFFKQAHKHFSGDKFPNNVAKNLRNAYSQGETAANAVFRKMTSRGHTLPGGSKELYANNTKEAPYFDALEMLELFIDLDDNHAEEGAGHAENTAD
jgi:hypothetical protein